MRIVFWEATVACNLDCIHCRRLEVSHALLQNELSTAEALRLMDAIREVGNPVVILSGGEPLLRPDIFEIAQHAHALGLGVALATNGTLIDSLIADKIRESGIRRVSVSLDGADAATHDGFRKVSGSFDRALSGIQQLRDAGVEFQINATITRHNVLQLSALYDLACRLGAVALHIFMLVPVGCGEKIPDDVRLSPEECEKTLAQFYELSLQRKIQTKATCAPQYYRLLVERDRQQWTEQLPSDMPRTPRGCLAGFAVCFVSHDGEVFPCGYLPVSAGNVRTESFKTIWQEAGVFRELRDPSLLQGKCGACNYRAVCMGCRARAFAATGNYLGEEPDCIYVPPHYCEE